MFLDVSAGMKTPDHIYFSETSQADFSPQITCSPTPLLLPFWSALVVFHGPLKCHIIYNASLVLFFLSLTCPVKLMASVMVSVQMTSKMSLPILTSLPNSSTIFLKTHVYKYIHRYPAGNCTEFIFKSGAFHLRKISQIYTSLSLSSIWRDRYLIHPFIKHLLRSN